jgi:hypothetical protein
VAYTISREFTNFVGAVSSPGESFNRLLIEAAETATFGI